VRIDWVTLIAQLVNFAILVALLKRFLYGRILRAIDSRERDIASRIESAERSREEADRKAESLAKAQRELDEGRAAMLQEAEQEARQRLESMTLDAKNEVARTQTKWRSSVARQKRKFLSDLRSRTGEQICETARAALRDLADADLESRMVAVLERELGTLTEADRQLLVDAAGRSGATVRSAFPIAAADAKRVESRVREVIGDAPLRFETAGDLICGIELAAGERSVSWSVDGYVDRIEREMGDLIEREASAPAVMDHDRPVADAKESRARGPAPGGSDDTSETRSDTGVRDTGKVEAAS